MSQPRHHVFACTNQRPVGGRQACGTGVYERLLQELAGHPTLWKSVKVTPCGCLGNCFDGPNIVVYPDAVWYANVGPDDVAEIVSTHLEGGSIVERLQYEWP